MGTLIKANRTDVSKGNWKPADSQLCLYSWCNWTDLYQGHPTSPVQTKTNDGRPAGEKKKKLFQELVPNSSCLSALDSQ